MCYYIDNYVIYTSTSPHPNIRTAFEKVTAQNTTMKEVTGGRSYSLYHHLHKCGQWNITQQEEALLKGLHAWLLGEGLNKLSVNGKM